MKSIHFKCPIDTETICNVYFECTDCRCKSFNRGEYNHKPTDFTTGGFRCDDCNKYADYTSDDFRAINSPVNNQLTLF